MSPLVWYWGIIFAPLFLSAFGLPIPEEVPLIAGGSALAKGQVQWLLLGIVAFSGIAAGDIAVFLLGRRFGRHALSVGPFRRLATEARIRRAERLFRRQGGYALAIARFVPGVRALTFLSAGALKYPVARFVLIDGVMTCLSVGLWTGFGYLLSQRLFEAGARTWIVVGGVVAALLVLTFLFWRHRRRHRRRRSRRAQLKSSLFASPPEPVAEAGAGGLAANADSGADTAPDADTPPPTAPALSAEAADSPA